MKNIAIPIVASVLLSFTAVQAQDYKPDLQNNMGFGEVLKLWGPPQEKSELESKRQDVWRYGPESKVVFQNGKVVAWVGTNGIAGAAETAIKAPVGRPASSGVIGANADTSEVDDDSAVADILQDIIDEPEESPPAAVVSPRKIE